MAISIYSATGCVRCKITKNYLSENQIGFEEFDFKAEGKEAFAQFYRTNRSQIFRDKDGVEFPVYHDGDVIRQGVSVILGHLMAGDGLAGFIGRNQLHGEWIDGFNISAGDPEQVDHLIAVLQHLKKNSLKIQSTSQGQNSAVLGKLLDLGLVDRLLMDVVGPAELYESLTGKALDPDELAKSIELAARCPEFDISTTIAPLKRADGTVDFLTPEEIGATAELIKTASGNNKLPYVLKSYSPDSATDEDLKGVEPLPSSALFKYRTQARRFQVMCEIEK